MKTTYEEIVKIFKENDCELYTTEDEYKLIQRPSKTRFQFKSSCGHDNVVLLTNFVNKKTGVKCKHCIKTQIIQKLIDYNKDNDSASSKGHIQENKVFNIITKLLFNNFQIVKTYEGCRADFLVKPKEIVDDKWLGIQLKTTRSVSHNLYGFRMHKNIYQYIILLCYCLSDNAMWLIPFESVSHVKHTINIGITEKSFYNKYRVNENTIISKLIEYYNSAKPNKSENLMIPTNVCQQNEIKYRKIREEFFLNFIKFFFKLD